MVNFHFLFFQISPRIWKMRLVQDGEQIQIEALTISTHFRSSYKYLIHCQSDDYCAHLVVV